MSKLCAIGPFRTVSTPIGWRSRRDAASRLIGISAYPTILRTTWTATCQLSRRLAMAKPLGSARASDKGFLPMSLKEADSTGLDGTTVSRGQTRCDLCGSAPNPGAAWDPARLLGGYSGRPRQRVPHGNWSRRIFTPRSNSPRPTVATGPRVSSGQLLRTLVRGTNRLWLDVTPLGPSVISPADTHLSSRDTRLLRSHRQLHCGDPSQQSARLTLAWAAS